MRGQNLLMARRLVEAGVPFVNVYDFRQQGQNWDAHFKVFDQHRDHLLPVADRSLAALIEDLEARGLLESTLVVALGEFGRTPRINKDAGRDHWPKACFAILAGGGMKVGQVVGQTSKWGDAPRERPLHYQNVLATLYQNLGIDVREAMLRDRLNRPLPVLDHREPIAELVG
jgi:uncharacterized protein (DUF1501 family)